jgi:hypothetical protein
VFAIARRERQNVSQLMFMSAAADRRGQFAIFLSIILLSSSLVCPSPPADDNANAGEKTER